MLVFLSPRITDLVLLLQLPIIIIITAPRRPLSPVTRERERADAEPRVAEQPARGRAEAARRPEVHVDLGLS